MYVKKNSIRITYMTTVIIFILVMYMHLFYIRKNVEPQQITKSID